MSRYVAVGDSVYDKRDELVHLVVEVAGEIACMVACQRALRTTSDRWCRVATNYLEESPLGPRWRVFEPINCMGCVACLP